VIIYEYDLEDGTQLRLVFPGPKDSLEQAAHVNRDGKAVQISPAN
jgi:hypothetical protein